MGYQGEGLGELVRRMGMLVLDMANERLEDQGSVESAEFLRRVMLLGSEEEKKLAREYRKGSKNNKKLREVLREKPKVKEVGELNEDGTGIIDAEFVEE